MPFDAKRFMKEKFIPVIREIPVPDLKDFFPEGEAPVWKVRGLTGQELGRANQAAEKNKSISAIVDGLVGDSTKEKTEAIKNLLGVSAFDTPADVAKRLEYLVLGSVEPECTLDIAIKLCTINGVVFFNLTNIIVELTGIGQTVGKQKPCGETPVSEPASPSVIEADDSSSK